ncbi:MAG TPA: hypothetical protein VKA15_19580, partial [Isosphaeraceae bacterium]|nr:hypothetical protein [Isosphaeraceae bacterium]
LSGITVIIYDRSGGNLLAGPMTSDANGKVCPNLSSGNFWVDPTGSYRFPLDKYVWIAQTFGIPNNGVGFWPVTLQPGWACCPTVSFPLPTTLYLTVCSQTFTMIASVINAKIQGWAPEGAEPATITTDHVADVTNCNLGGWDGMSTSIQAVPFWIQLFCPSGPSSLPGTVGVCGIGHYNGRIGAFDEFAICPAECTGFGNAYTCCSGAAGPGPSVDFTLTGTIGETVSLSGSMPASMPDGCVFPPAAPWPLPCPGSAITVTN